MTTTRKCSMCLVGLHIRDVQLFLRFLRDAFPNVTWSAVSVVHGEGSASYETLARECRATARLRDGSPLPIVTAWDGLRMRYSIPKADGYILASWSAGYGFTRDLLRVEGRPVDVVAVVSLDSIYGGLEADGVTVTPADLAPWVKLAEEAVAGGVAFVVASTDINYMESLSLPPRYRYASTGSVSDAIAFELALVPVGSQRVSIAAGSLLLRRFDGADQAAHLRAVRDRGPEMVVEAARLWLGEHELNDATPATWVAVRRYMNVKDDGPSPVDIDGKAPTEPPPSTVPAPPAAARAVTLLSRVRGADVSHWQGPGEGNQWHLWKCGFGFARVATSGKRDETFAENWEKMQGLILPGSYAWFDPGYDADAQADVALEELHDSDVELRGLKMAIDVEPGPYGENAAGLARWRALTDDGAGMVRWVRRMRDAGCDVGCYTGRWAWFWGPLLAQEGCWLWVSDASTRSLTVGYPTLIPAGWPAWNQAEPIDWNNPGARPLIWQCGKQTVPGEPAAIDLDYFRGDEVALRQWSRRLRS